jgi:hypothetical protein
LDVFGTNVKQAVYWRLMSETAISSDKIISNPDVFVSALKGIFGSGYPLAERSILKELRKTFGTNLIPSSIDILEAIDLASKDITVVRQST